MEDDFLFFSGGISEVGLTGFSINNEVGGRASFYFTEVETLNSADIGFGILTGQLPVGTPPGSLTGDEIEFAGDIKSFNSGAAIFADDEDGNPDPTGEVLGTVVDVRVFDVDVEVDDFTNAIATGNPLTVWELFAEGDDLILGSDEFNEELFGFGGDDVIETGGGDDTLVGGSGDDTLRGEEGNDILRGSSGDDRLEGGAGLDTIRGNNGDDTVKAGTFSDLVTGGKDDDRLFGNGGADTLIGGQGDDRLIGGGGADVFVFGQNVGDDTVVRFRQGVDTLKVNGTTNGFADLDIVADGADVVISFGTTTVTLLDQNVGAFTADDFMF